MLEILWLLFSFNNFSNAPPTNNWDTSPKSLLSCALPGPQLCQSTSLSLTHYLSWDTLLASHYSPAADGFLEPMSSAVMGGHVSCPLCWIWKYFERVLPCSLPILFVLPQAILCLMVRTSSESTDVDVYYFPTSHFHFSVTCNSWNTVSIL